MNITSGQFHATQMCEGEARGAWAFIPYHFLSHGLGCVLHSAPLIPVYFSCSPSEPRCGEALVAPVREGVPPTPPSQCMYLLYSSPGHCPLGPWDVLGAGLPGTHSFLNYLHFAKLVSCISPSEFFFWNIKVYPRHDVISL